MDPDSQHSGWGLIRPNEGIEFCGLVWHVLVRNGPAKKLTEVVSDIDGIILSCMEICKTKGWRLVVVCENQFSAKNWKSSFMIVEIRRTWETLAARHGLQTDKMMPLNWRSFVFPGQNRRTTKKRIWKRLAKELVLNELLENKKHMTNEEKEKFERSLFSDTAEGCCIGKAWMRYNRGCKVQRKLC